MLREPRRRSEAFGLDPGGIIFAIYVHFFDFIDFFRLDGEQPTFTFSIFEAKVIEKLADIVNDSIVAPPPGHEQRALVDAVDGFLERLHARDAVLPWQDDGLGQSDRALNVDRSLPCRELWWRHGYNGAAAEVDLRCCWCRGAGGWGRVLGQRSVFHDCCETVRREVFTGEV